MGGPTDATTSVWVRAGTTLFVTAQAVRNATGGFTLKMSSTPDDDFGNTFATAQAFSLSTAGAGGVSGVINSTGDLDMFSIRATKSGLGTVTLTPAGSAAFTACSPFMTSSQHSLGQAVFETARKARKGLAAGQRGAQRGCRRGLAGLRMPRCSPSPWSRRALSCVFVSLSRLSWSRRQRRLR